MVGLLLLGKAWATWTVLGTDPATGEVGAAGATCSGMVWMVAEVVPDKGAVVAQYATNLKQKRAGRDAIADGATPEEAVAIMADDAVDEDVAIRQYAAVSWEGPPAAYTGAEVEAISGWQSGQITTPEGEDGGSWSVQGNTLHSEEVLTGAAAAMQGDGPLAERLLSALEAGAAAGGDDRCDPSVGAKSAFLWVAKPGDEGDLSLQLRADPLGNGDPIARLRERYEAGATGCAVVPMGGVGRWGLGIAAGLLALRRRA